RCSLSTACATIAPVPSQNRPKNARYELFKQLKMNTGKNTLKVWPPLLQSFGIYAEAFFIGIDLPPGNRISINQESSRNVGEA
ncbi:MAG TPA: hypothetical protein VFG54_04485, partial [Prolixibacteraceae bacterium]|nr:hypothetical protein [Prolixibacteraceae bacterium]